MTCTGCEGKPAPENDPCAVCGLSASPTNTAGLEVVAWAWDHWTHLTDKWTRRATFDEPQDGSRVRNIEPLVTAASAQARIEALEDAGRMLAAKAEHAINEGFRHIERAQAAEARADRLATLVKRLSEDLSAALERAYEADAEWVKAKYPNGASPIRLLAALQDQPK